MAVRTMRRAACFLSWWLSITLLGSCTRDAREPTQTARQMAEATGLTIPESARVVEFYDSGHLIDPTWVAKVELSKEALDALLRSIEKWASDPTHVRNRLSGSVPWWRPGDRLAAKQYLVERNALVSVVVAKEGGRLFVYLEYMVF